MSDQETAADEDPDVRGVVLTGSGEAFSTGADLQEALEAWGEDIILYGCIPSNIMVPALCPKEEFREYVESTLTTIERNPCRIILGVADNVMPEADIKRVEYISEMIKGS